MKLSVSSLAVLFSLSVEFSLRTFPSLSLFFLIFVAVLAVYFFQRIFLFVPLSSLRCFWGESLDDVITMGRVEFHHQRR